MGLFRSAVGYGAHVAGLSKLAERLGYSGNGTNGKTALIDTTPNPLTDPVRSWAENGNEFYGEPTPVELPVAMGTKANSAPAAKIPDPSSVIERDSVLNYQPKNPYETHVRDVIKSFKVDHMPQRKQEPDADYKSRMSSPLPFYETRSEVTEYFRRGQILKDKYAMQYGSDSAKEIPLIGKYIDEKKARLQYEIDEGKIPSIVRIVPAFENDIGNFALHVDFRMKQGKNLEDSIKSAIVESRYGYIKTNADAFEAYSLAKENADKVAYRTERAEKIKQEIMSAKVSLKPEAPVPAQYQLAENMVKKQIAIAAQQQYEPAGGMYNTAKKFISGFFRRR